MLAIEEELGSKVGISHALYGLGEVASALGEYQSAREHYKKTLAISEELGRKDGIASALYGLGKAANSLGEYQIAREYYNRALNIFKNMGSPNSKIVKESIDNLDNMNRSKDEPQA